MSPKTSSLKIGFKPNKKISQSKLILKTPVSEKMCLAYVGYNQILPTKFNFKFTKKYSVCICRQDKQLPEISFRSFSHHILGSLLIMIYDKHLTDINFENTILFKCPSILNVCEYLDHIYGCGFSVYFSSIIPSIYAEFINILNNSYFFPHRFDPYHLLFESLVTLNDLVYLESPIMKILKNIELDNTSLTF